MHFHRQKSWEEDTLLSTFSHMLVLSLGAFSLTPSYKQRVAELGFESGGWILESCPSVTAGSLSPAWVACSLKVLNIHAKRFRMQRRSSSPLSTGD